MRISRIGWSRPSVVVLGAGATRGASHVGAIPGPLPPLDADFFTQAQRLTQAKRSDLVTGLVANTVAIFGSNFQLTMEGFLTQVEQLSNVFEDYKLQGRPPDSPYRPVREQFLQVLAAVIDEAIGRVASCDHHKTLAASLTPKDTILSFNYDPLIDMTLRDHFPQKWNPRFGYGVPARVKGKRAAGTFAWAGKDPKTGEISLPAASVTLLKMHGSLNWFPAPVEYFSLLELRQRWWHQHGDLDFEIAPPEWNKPIRSGIYERVWSQARKALKSVNSLVMIGYSLPANDLPAQALFMADALRKKGAPPKLRLLVIVNPDREARARIRKVLISRLDKKTRVITFDSFADYAAFIA